jgi:hypothetical protein
MQQLEGFHAFVSRVLWVLACPAVGVSRSSWQEHGYRALRNA